MAGIRKEPSKAPRQCTPAQAAESIREDDSGICQLQADEGLDPGGRVNSGELPQLS